MIRRFTVLLVLSQVVGPAFAASESPAASEQKERGPVAALKRTWGKVLGEASSFVSFVTSPFVSKPSIDKTEFQAKLMLEPGSKISIAKVRQIKAVVRLENPSKKTQVLRFPSSQRLSAVLRDETGRIVSSASEDANFLDENDLVTVNPLERVEFEVMLPTRELHAGRSYRLEAGVVNQEGLRVGETISVEP